MPASTFSSAASSAVDVPVKPNYARSKRARTFYIDDDVYAWMQDRFGGDARGMSRFIRELLRECMDIDLKNQNQKRKSNRV